MELKTTAEDRLILRKQIDRCDGFGWGDDDTVCGILDDIDTLIAARQWQPIELAPKKRLVDILTADERRFIDCQWSAYDDDSGDGVWTTQIDYATVDVPGPAYFMLSPGSKPDCACKGNPLVECGK